jgi:urocanate hydratase
MLVKDLPSTESGACWAFFSGGAGPGALRRFTAQAIVADGTADAGERIARWLANAADPKTA